MALIGKIAIAMSVNTSGFSKGLATASAALNNFEKGAYKNLVSGSKNLTAGLSTIAQGALQVGTNLMSKNAKAFYGSIARDVGAGGLKIATSVMSKDAKAFYGSLARDAITAVTPMISKMGALAVAFKASPIGQGLSKVAQGAIQASQGVAQLAMGFGKLALVGVAKGVSFVSTAFMSMVSAGRQAVNLIGKFGVIAGGIAAYGLYKLVAAGSDSIETINLIKETFKGSSSVVVDASNQMADAFGTSKREFLQASGMLGGIFKNAGYTTDAAAGLSVQIVKLAGDLASFKNLSFGEALNKITAGITGESEPLKRIGINLMENTVKQEAYRMGIAKVGAELTEQQKVQARLSALSRQTVDAQGDLARTADEVANSTRGFQGRIENLMATIGTQLQPLAKAVFGELNMAVQVGGLMWNDYMNSSVSATSATVAGNQQQVESMGWVQKGVGFIVDAWYTLQVAFKTVQSYVTAGIGTLVQGLVSLSSGFDTIAKSFGFAETGATAFLQTIADDLKNLSNTQWEGLQEKLREPWPSESINDYFAQAKAKTEALRSQLVTAGFDPNKFTPVGADTLTKDKKVKAMKFAGAEGFGSSEAANTILRSQFSGGLTNKEQAQKKTAENTTRMVKQLEDIAKSVSGTALETISAFA